MAPARALRSAMHHAMAASAQPGPSACVQTRAVRRLRHRAAALCARCVRSASGVRAAAGPAAARMHGGSTRCDGARRQLRRRAAGTVQARVAAARRAACAEQRGRSAHACYVRDAWSSRPLPRAAVPIRRAPGGGRCLLMPQALPRRCSALSFACRAAVLPAEPLQAAVARVGLQLKRVCAAAAAMRRPTSQTSAAASLASHACNTSAQCSVSASGVRAKGCRLLRIRDLSLCL